MSPQGPLARSGFCGSVTYSELRPVDQLELVLDPVDVGARRRQLPETVRGRAHELVRQPRAQLVTEQHAVDPAGPVAVGEAHVDRESVTEVKKMCDE